MSLLKQDKIINIILMGSPEFSLPTFEAILNHPRFKIVAVFSQSDKAKGRGQKLKAPAVKSWAESHGLKVHQAEKIKTEFELIKSLAPDLILVMAYGQIIPLEILNLPKYKCVNVHASLLPKYRGAACLNAPILNQDEKTGLSFMLMSEGLDTGDIIKQVELNLNKRVKLSDLHDKLSILSAENVGQILEDYIDGKLIPWPQDEAKASYVPRLKKNDGLLDWSLSAEVLDAKIRGLNPWPSTFSFIKLAEHKKLLKILEAEIEESQNQNLEPGLIYVENAKLKISCGQNILNVLRLQIEGSKALSAQEFLAGYSHLLGQVLS